MQTAITIHGITLEVEFDYTPHEHNNWGHPDDRLPDVDEEVILMGAYVKDVNVLSIIHEDVQTHIETVILGMMK